MALPLARSIDGIISRLLFYVFCFLGDASQTLSASISASLRNFFKPACSQLAARQTTDRMNITSTFPRRHRMARRCVAEKHFLIYLCYYPTSHPSHTSLHVQERRMHELSGRSKRAGRLSMHHKRGSPCRCLTSCQAL